MKRRLNLWIVGPSLALGGLISWLGWVVTDLSCRADQPSGAPGCPGWAAAAAVVCIVGGTMAMAMVLGITARSIAEYRETQDARRQTPDGSRSDESREA